MTTLYELIGAQEGQTRCPNCRDGLEIGETCMVASYRKLLEAATSEAAALRAQVMVLEDAVKRLKGLQG